MMQVTTQYDSEDIARLKMPSCGVSNAIQPLYVQSLNICCPDEHTMAVTVGPWQEMLPQHSPISVTSWMVLLPVIQEASTLAITLDLMWVDCS